MGVTWYDVKWTIPAAVLFQFHLTYLQMQGHVIDVDKRGKHIKALKEREVILKKRRVNRS